MQIQNTLTRKKDTLEGDKEKKINLFVCGPTVYDHSHIGHARTYVFFDSFVKYLRKNGYDVFYLQNITDIDDKIIARANENQISAKEIASTFLKEYYSDMELLKVNAVSRYAKATECIKEIIGQIERLLEKGIAYKKEDGIYYDISKFKDYGKLSKRTTQQAEDGTSRIDEGVEKKNKGDFCVWKFSNKEPKWTTPWKEGRPGWHIEDTAIAESFFGPQYDVHGGGRDLMFPHHEAEIALMEGISEKVPFVRYWMHTGFLTVNGEKMSKSLGNFVTIKDFIKKHSPRILRFFILKSHYRSPLDYEEKNINQCSVELRKIDQFISDIECACQENTKEEKEEIKTIIQETRQKMKAALEDDFNTPLAISELFTFINKINPEIKNLSSLDAKNITEFLKGIDSFLEFIFCCKEERLVCYQDKENISKEIERLTKEREKARKEKDFQKADEIRKKIADMGYCIEDTKDGFKIKKI